MSTVLFPIAGRSIVHASVRVGFGMLTRTRQTQRCMECVIIVSP